MQVTFSRITVNLKLNSVYAPVPAYIIRYGIDMGKNASKPINNSFLFSLIFRLHRLFLK